MKKYIISGVIGTLAILGTYGVVLANPSYSLTTTQTSSSTTSPMWIPTGGTATSSLVFDSYIAGKPTLTDKAVVLVQLAASTSPGTAYLKMNIQYTPDLSGFNCAVTTSLTASPCDWYEDGGNINPLFATTSKPFDISTVNQFTYAFASSTSSLGSIPIAGQATSTRAFIINTPTRYTRIVLSSPPGATSLSYWAQIVPIKQQQ